jgi:PadR family transcriptional regulator PadR
MSPREYLSYSAAVILQALANGYRYGFDIMDITGLPSGTVYPALRRLENAGLIASKWEKHDVAQQEGRPPRKYYEVTKAGDESLAEAVKRYRYMERLIPRAARKLRTASERG